MIAKLDLKGFLIGIPHRYRALVRCLSFILSSFFILFIVIVTTVQADVSPFEVLGEYVWAVIAILIFSILAVTACIIEVSDFLRGRKFNKIIGGQIAITDFNERFRRNPDKAMRKLVRMIAIGHVSAIIDVEADTITECEDITPYEKMISEPKYKKERRKLAVRNYIAIFVLIVALLLNAYYVLGSASISKDSSLSAVKSLGKMFLAVIIMMQISILAYYYPSLTFKNSKKIRASGRRLGVTLMVINMIAIVVWLVLIFAVIKSAEA